MTYTFLAVALMRIPKFRQLFKRKILESMPPSVVVEEWSGLDWSLDLPEEEEKAERLIFDWDAFFYRHVPDGPRKKKA